jgi:hypothetical protein
MWSHKRGRHALLAGLLAFPLLLGGCTDALIDPGLDPSKVLPEIGFVGSNSCQTCHTPQAYWWRQSGHPYKLVEVKDGKAPTFPYSKIADQPPAGSTWNDVLYVVGGYGYKSRYVGKDGFFITAGGNNQWDLNTKAWSNYSKDQKIPYNCGPCHTTGYSAEGNQKGIPGLVGTWKEDGVGCEACHGPGSQHVFNPGLYRMKIDKSVDACAQCHNRNGANNPEITAQNGFLMHRDALHAMRLTKGHRDFTCVTCHDAHRGALFSKERQVPPVNRTCESCHATARQSLARSDFAKSKATQECTTCHMAPMTVSAVPTKSPWKGDMKTHLVKINTDPAAPQWYGTNNNRSHAYITVGFACLSCHDNKDQAWAGQYVKRMHKW